MAGKNRLIEGEKIRLQDEQQELEWQWHMGQLTIDQHNAETSRLQTENSAIIAMQQLALDHWKTELSQMATFGYTDEQGV